MSDYFEVKRNPNLIEIPEGATNGDMIKAVFPNENISQCEESGDYNLFVDGYWRAGFREIWWNSPYRKEQE